MTVLGLSGIGRDAAAALVVNGAVTAAAAEESFVRIPGVGWRHIGGPPLGSVSACLASAGLSVEDVGTIAVVDDPLHHEPNAWWVQGENTGVWTDEYSTLCAGLRARPLVRVAPHRAAAAQVVAACPTDELVVLIVELDDVEPAGRVYLARGSDLREADPIAGLDRLACGARRVAAFLGCPAVHACRGLERLAAQGLPEFTTQFGEAVEWQPPSGISVREDRLAAMLEEVSLDGFSLADVRSPNVRVQQRRRAVAASFRDRLTELAEDIVESLKERTGLAAVGVGGSFFASSHVNSRLQQVFGNAVTVAPVPEASGLAVGAAVAIGGTGLRQPLRSLMLGPKFSETDMKTAIENCRLDYVYEPDWPRLLRRVSGMLSDGKTVAWFQGATGFGPRSLGSRSVLADPSNRYVRDNINRYLKQRAEDHPLAISMPIEAVQECLDPPVDSPFMLLRATVREEWRDRLRAALDHRHSAQVHTVAREQAPELWQLLDTHRARSGVPALIHTELCGRDEPTACTPRDAIRTTYSSAIDALVMGRFLLMKDYWLLRSDGER